MFSTLWAVYTVIMYFGLVLLLLLISFSLFQGYEIPTNMFFNSSLTNEIMAVP